MSVAIGTPLTDDMAAKSDSLTRKSAFIACTFGASHMPCQDVRDYHFVAQ